MHAQSCLTLCDPMDYMHQAPLSTDFSIKNTGVQCSSQHCLSQPGHGNNLDAHQQTNGQGSCGTYTPWNITQPLKRIHLNQF